jgi:hypothetical protein
LIKIKPIFWSGIHSNNNGGGNNDLIFDKELIIDELLFRVITILLCIVMYIEVNEFWTNKYRIDENTS